MQHALRLSTSPWFEARDDPRGLRLYDRHYSARAIVGRHERRLFVGPGQKLVLLTHAADAVLVWRRFVDRCPLAADVNCAVFRREPGAARASDLILAAEPFALARWGPCVVYTYVDPGAIASSNPGYCFQRAGWHRVGRTAGGHGRAPLVVLAKHLGR